jgi:thymidylate synthase
MKFKLFFIALFICNLSQINAQANKSEIAKITETLVDYIEGSTNGQPNRLKKAFHSDLNLYYIKNNELKIWSGKKYIESTKEGKPTGETGKIISIDFENDIAVAKVQISNPRSKAPYIDYFMLTKIKGHWTIIHKMFTKRVNK